MCCARALIEEQGCESGLWLIVIESVTSFQKWKSQRSFDVTLLGQEFEARESVVLHNGDAAGGELDGAAKHAELVHLQDQGWQAVGGSCGELKKREAFAKISKNNTILYHILCRTVSTRMFSLCKITQV